MTKIPRAASTRNLLWPMLMLLGSVAAEDVLAQSPKNRSGLTKPVYRVADGATSNSIPAQSQPATEHPLVPTIRLAKQVLERIDTSLTDYTCVLVKQERIGGRLNPREFIFTKIRHEPFSVYMKFQKPTSIAGREALYVRGHNNGNLVGHEAQGWKSTFGSMSLKPDGALAMRGQRYPITEVGLRNMTKRLIEVAEKDTQYGECEVQYFKNAVVHGGSEPRTCTCVQVTHPHPRDHFTFHIARVFFDDELQLPIRYASYGWPTRPGAEPELIEEYTYLDIKLNPGLSEQDFDVKNPAYGF